MIGEAKGAPGKLPPSIVENDKAGPRLIVFTATISKDIDLSKGAMLSRSIKAIGVEVESVVPPSLVTTI